MTQPTFKTVSQIRAFRTEGDFGSFEPTADDWADYEEYLSEEESYEGREPEPTDWRDHARQLAFQNGHDWESLPW